MWLNIFFKNELLQQSLRSKEWEVLWSMFEEQVLVKACTKQIRRIIMFSVYLWLKIHKKQVLDQ